MDCHPPILFVKIQRDWQDCQSYFNFQFINDRDNRNVVIYMLLYILYHKYVATYGLVKNLALQNAEKVLKYLSN